MRTVVAVIAATQGIVGLTHGGARLSELLFTCLLLVLCGACLLVGFLTPLASLLAATIVFAHALAWFPMAGSSLFDDRIAAFEWIVMAAAVALLGPGAFSVDAYLFGRHEIVIPPGPRRPQL
jgi:uncharacterized membrane protein YphA (DoxX/SURF4 family)